MYCHACGAKNTPNRNKCISCGEELVRSASRTGRGSSTREMNTMIQQSGNKEGAPAQRPNSGKTESSKKSPFTWLIPVLLSLTITMGLAVYYMYEENRNEQVLELQTGAEEQALAGRYQDALTLLDQAIRIRPRHEGLQQDRAITAEAMELKGELIQVQTNLKNNKVTEAQKKLSVIRTALKNREEPMFKSLKNSVSAAQVTLSVMKVKAELDKLDTVPQLGEKLAAISKLKGKEAEALQKQIVTKIVETSLSDIAERLKQNDFSGATLAVEAGLGYAKGDERLLEQKERIRQEQLAFERAEAKRIEVARQQAAQEELANRTAAVEVLDLVTALDNYGDLQIAGEIKNVATRAISSVQLSVSMYNNYGDFIGSGTISASPYYIESQEVGYFSYVLYGAYTEGYTVIDNITWYLE